MKKVILSYNYYVGVFAVILYPLLGLSLICFMWIGYFHGNDSLTLLGYIILSIILLLSSIYIFIAIGVSLVQWVVIDKNGIRSYNLLRKIDDYLWNEIHHYKKDYVYNRWNLKTNSAGVYIFYQQRTYLKDYTRANSRKAPLGVHVTNKNINFINEMVEINNIPESYIVFKKSK